MFHVNQRVSFKILMKELCYSLGCVLAIFHNKRLKIYWRVNSPQKKGNHIVITATFIEYYLPSIFLFMIFVIFDSYNYLDDILHFTDKKNKKPELRECSNLQKQQLAKSLSASKWQQVKWQLVKSKQAYSRPMSLNCLFSLFFLSNFISPLGTLRLFSTYQLLATG